MKRPRAARARLGLLVLVAAGLGTGCAGQRYVRETTEITAGHIDSLQADYSRYLQRVESHAATRIDALADQRQRLARAERGLKAVVARGPHGDLHDDLVAAAAEDLKTDRAVAQLAVVERAALREAQKPLDKASLKRLQELSKHLVEMAKPAAFTGQVRFLVEYFQAVGKAVSELDEKARTAKKDADTTGPKSSE